MSNHDQATRVIFDRLPISNTAEREAHACLIADELAYKGLLAPEQIPPHPTPPMDVHQPAWELDNKGNYSRNWVSRPGKRIWITDSRGWGESLTIGQARHLVAVLLSAINHKDTHDE